MARKTQVILTDDVDGSEASQTVSFGLDGVAYEIDLNDSHAEQLREQLETWVSSGRRVGGRRTAGTRRTAGGDRERAARIREWARANATAAASPHLWLRLTTPPTEDSHGSAYSDATTGAR